LSRPATPANSPLFQLRVGLLARLKRWLEPNSLTLNEPKTLLLEVQQAGFKFLGFGVSWRRGKRGNNYPHIEPHPQSQRKLRAKLQEKLNHWTQW
jgi:hypothetical protein